MRNEADSDSEGTDQMRREKWKQPTGSLYGITLSSNTQYTLYLRSENWIQLAYAHNKTEEFCCHEEKFQVKLIQWCLFVPCVLTLTHWGRGHLNCLNARSRGLNNLNQRLYCVSLNIYNKFANYFCELKVSGNTHQRPYFLRGLEI